MNISFSPVRTSSLDPDVLPGNVMIQTSSGLLVIKVHGTLFVAIERNGSRLRTAWNTRWYSEWGTPIRVLSAGDSVHIEL